MRMVQLCVSSFIAGPAGWAADWAWGLPLIVLTVIIHVSGLVLIRDKTVRPLEHVIRRQQRKTLFVTVLGTVTLLVISLHAFEAAIWAAAYRLLHAIPDNSSAMLYSLNAITSYGHTNLELEQRWHLMGALEALNGWLLFGLSTAFLFAIIQQFGSPESGDETARSASITA